MSGGDWPDLLGPAGNMLADDGHESGAVRVLDDETNADNPACRHHLYEEGAYLQKKPVSEFAKNTSNRYIYWLQVKLVYIISILIYRATMFCSRTESKRNITQC